MCAKWCIMSNDRQNIASSCSHISVICMTSWIEFFAVMTDDISRLDKWWFKTILSDMNILYRHIWTKTSLQAKRHSCSYSLLESGPLTLLPQHVKHSTHSIQNALKWPPAPVIMITSRLENNALRSPRHVSTSVWQSKCH